MKKSWKKIERVEVYISFFMKVLMALGIGFSVFRGDYVNAILILMILLLTYIPSLLTRKYRIFLPLEFDFFIVAVIFFSLFLGEIHDFYFRFWWWDLYLHAESGFFLGMFGFILVYILNEEVRISVHMKAGFLALFAFTFAMTIGVLWEIMEFGMDSFFNFNMQKSGLVDTMWDLIFGGLGAAVITVLGYLWLKFRISSYFFDNSLAKFLEKNRKIIGGKDK